MSLYFDGTLIGTIEDAFFNNQQWYGTFEFVSDNFMSAIANRAKEYIEFCQDWNEACERDDPLPHSLFDSYKDMTESDKWMVIDDDCESTRILCPNLFGEEISCIPFDRK